MPGRPANSENVTPEQSMLPAPELTNDPVHVEAEEQGGAGSQQKSNMVPLADFDLIKVMVVNRAMIVHCVMLKKCTSDEEADALKAEMRKNPELTRVLNVLEGVDAGAAGDDKDDKDKDKHGDAEDDLDGKAVGLEILNLEELAFSNGSHFMANKRCQLPEGSFRKQEKGYEEVHVPALKPKPFAADENLVPIESLPAYAQPAFEGFKALNRIQSRLYKVRGSRADTEGGRD